MVNEKRLIDAMQTVTKMSGRITLLIRMGANPMQIYNEILQVIAEAPTVDVIELPCKIGDMVWGIKKFNHETERVKQGIVHMMFFGEDMRLCICVKGVCRGEWGKNVFATKEEALAKMEEVTDEFNS